MFKKCHICGIDFKKNDYMNHNIQTGKETLKNISDYLTASNYKENDMNIFFFESCDLRGVNTNYINYSFSLKLYECRIIWLKENGYDKIADYLESRKKDIRIEFNKLYQKEIDFLEKRILDNKVKMINEVKE